MRCKMEENKKRKTISISIDKVLNDTIKQITNNKSMYISLIIVEKLKELNIDVSKIKL